jgi:hypothetical protein
MTKSNWYATWASQHVICNLEMMRMADVSAPSTALALTVVNGSKEDVCWHGLACLTRLRHKFVSSALHGMCVIFVTACI